MILLMEKKRKEDVEGGREDDIKEWEECRAEMEQNWHSIDVIKLVIYVEWRRFGGGYTIYTYR